MNRAAYGRAPAHAYFEGCPNGGREALMNVQRYPELFDGIVARAPALNAVAAVGAWQRNAKALVRDHAVGDTVAARAIPSLDVLSALHGSRQLHLHGALKVAAIAAG
jgi:hypothetical protein